MHILIYENILPLLPNVEITISISLGFLSSIFLKSINPALTKAVESDCPVIKI